MNWYLSQPATWIALIVPMLVSLAFAYRGWPRFSFSAPVGPLSLAWFAAAAGTLQFSQWSAEGLHVWPTFLVLLPVLLIARALPSAATAFACMFSLVLFADITLCLVEFSKCGTLSCLWYQGIGGAGATDALLLFPLAAAGITWGLRSMCEYWGLFGTAKPAKPVRGSARGSVAG